MRATLLILALVVTACGGAAPGPTVAEPTATATTPSIAVDDGRVWFEVLGVSQAAPDAGLLELATTTDELTAGWSRFGLAGDAPSVDLTSTVVVLIGRGEDACPDELVAVIRTDSVLDTRWLAPPGGCDEPFIPTGYAVQLHRADLGTSFTFTMSSFDGTVRETFDLPPYDGPGAPPPPDVTTQPSTAEIAALFDGHPLRPCSEFPTPLDRSAPVDGPVSDDAAVAAAQQERADRGLASDVVTVEGLLADPDNLGRGFDFPLTQVEFDEFFARQDLAVQEDLGLYLEEQAATYAWSYYDQRDGSLVLAFTEGLDDRRRDLADRFSGAIFEVVGAASTEQDRQSIVTDLVATQDETGLPITGGGPGFDRAMVGLLDPTREDLDTLAGLVDVSTVCVTTEFSGVPSAVGDAPEPDATPEPTAVPVSLPLVVADAPPPVTDVDLASPRPIPDDPDVVVRSGAAGPVLQCDGRPTSGGSSDVGGPGHGAADPENALRVFVEQGLFDLPRSGYRAAATDDGRVLFTHDVDGRPRVAVIVADRAVVGDEVLAESGWSMTVFATCDPAEAQPSADDGRAVMVWTDTDGNRLPTSTIQSRLGAEHCDWQSVTFLTMDDQQYLRDPEGRLSRSVAAAYDGDVESLPGDAVDTGYRRDTDGLWLAADGSRAYVGGPSGFEAWPRATEQIGCR